MTYRGRAAAAIHNETGIAPKRAVDAQSQIDCGKDVRRNCTTASPGRLTGRRRGVTYGDFRQTLGVHRIARCLEASHRRSVSRVTAKMLNLSPHRLTAHPVAATPSPAMR